MVAVVEINNACNAIESFAFRLQTDVAEPFETIAWLLIWHKWAMWHVVSVFEKRCVTPQCHPLQKQVEFKVLNVNF